MATRNTQHATRNTQHATRNTHSISDALSLSKPKAGYDIRYDYIRLFAVFAVVLMHSMDINGYFLSSEINENTLAALDSIHKVVLYPAVLFQLDRRIHNRTVDDPRRDKGL